MSFVVIYIGLIFVFVVASSLISKSVCETAVQECNAEQDEEGYDRIINYMYLNLKHFPVTWYSF